MTTSDKAKRATVEIGSLELEGFQMPDGSYRMSQTQAAESVGKSQRNAGRFLGSKGIKALRGEGYTPDTIEVESTDQSRGQARFNALPLDVVSAYWLWEASKGNQQAITLCYALMAETLERRFDAAFVWSAANQSVMPCLPSGCSRPRPSWICWVKPMPNQTFLERRTNSSDSS